MATSLPGWSEAENAILHAQLPDLHAFLTREPDPQCEELQQEYLLVQEQIDQCFTGSEEPYENCHGLLMRANTLFRRMSETGCRPPDIS